MSRAEIVFHDLLNGSIKRDLGYIAYYAQGRVLDLGAGTGRVAFMLAERGHNVVALDRDRELLDELDRRRAVRFNGSNGHHGQIISYHADALALPHGDAVLGRFDTIVMANGFCEIVGPRNRQRKLLRDLRAMLAPDGVIVAITADLSTIDGILPSDDLETRQGLLVRIAWLQEVYDDLDDDRAREWMWCRQTRLVGLPWCRNHPPFLQPFWPSDLANDARATGLRIASRRRIHDDESIDQIVTELRHG